MLAKHYLISREDTRGQVIQRFFRSHLRGKWLVDKEPIEQLLDARAFNEPSIRRNLLIVSNDKDSLASKDRRERPKV